MNFNFGPTVTFTPTALESQSSEAPSSSNGVFPRGPLSLSSPHAEIWVQGKQLLIRDRSSTYGTYVNGIRIQQQTLLEHGDIVTLGQHLPRSSAPQNVLDSQLSPIEASISIVGA